MTTEDTYYSIKIDKIPVGRVLGKGRLASSDGSVHDGVHVNASQLLTKESAEKFREEWGDDCHPFHLCIEDNSKDGDGVRLSVMEFGPADGDEGMLANILLPEKSVRLLHIALGTILAGRAVEEI